ncbi:MAG: VOC family protein, partial [Rhizobiaceae bacterium]|nr:VOC family protein [Rhizobiaceae bacterium]
MASPFIWYELMTSDLDVAERFYKAVVGWNTEPFPSAQVRYIVAKAGDAGVGGMMTMPDDVAAMGTPPMWLGYIRSDDVDAKTAAIKAAGGTVYQEGTDIPDVGRFSVVTDPQGATFMLLAPKGPDGEPAAPMTPGHIGWNELMAADWQTAFDFYSTQFGWKKDQTFDMGEKGTYQIFNTGGNSVGGMYNKPKEVP